MGMEQLQQQSIPTLLAYGIIAVYALYFVLDQVFNIAVLSPPELLWHGLVSVIPATLVLESNQRIELSKDSTRSQLYAAKSEAIREMLGLRGNGKLLKSLPAAREVIGTGVNTIARRKSISAPRAVTSELPSGLGNWDNSCYQNSILQALASLPTLQRWLEGAVLNIGTNAGSSTTGNLQRLVAQLRDAGNNGKHIWTPSKLKNMSSWQQQDAQEYFSKILDEMDKEAKKVNAAMGVKVGLESLNAPEIDYHMRDHDEEHSRASKNRRLAHNPLEGWLAQRVMCIRCGASDGYSMIPFNCLTVSLGTGLSYTLENCLDEYTRREDIEGVECRRCTLLHAEEKLRKIVPFKTIMTEPAQNANQSAKLAPALPQDLQAQVAKRLQAIQEALGRDDYSDKTIKGACQIAQKAFVSSTKSKEAIIGRPPQSLVVHVNRSVFSETTGMLSKNYAHVKYPLQLDLRPWTLYRDGPAVEYRLSAVVVHKGAHENGHYICYRQHPSACARDEIRNPEADEPSDEKWFRLSDADVYNASQSEALNPSAGGVFMLFYERIKMNLEPDHTILEEEFTEAAVSQKEVEKEYVESEPPTVPPSVISETDTEITDYDYLDAMSERDDSLHLAPAIGLHQLPRTVATPKDAVRKDKVRNNTYTAMSV
ncbi:cysteine proteinase [Dissoconium aciculare CBS 342.82]|uniref:ubiquitinyl hydrolase 1 n=1 Tax=Dissoconium aciculare CBS 342.82 TaxID=1314786 RepID=A0A6J3MH93_9PEZI|nr:cysteine proteinase [Dissoconium aciculare CBS 342.82]KAF1827064.1 cysteine proteinase [Dissoconium aciculare CBS 342.82]